MLAFMPRSHDLHTERRVLVNFARSWYADCEETRTQSSWSSRPPLGLMLLIFAPGSDGYHSLLHPQDRQIVDLSRVWLESQLAGNLSGFDFTRFLIGLREDTGDPLWLNLQGSHGGNEEHAPHTLIAGETGSGKGVLTQNLLLQMIAFNRPENFKLYVIDPKFGVDFFWISQAPHLARADRDQAGRR